MRLLLNMVARNEADRYLGACLSWIKPYVDDLFLYDDRSDDGTLEVAKAHGVKTQRRAAQIPSFMEAEGLFRETGWHRMMEALNPRSGDWVLCLDADEFPVPRERLRGLCLEADKKGFRSINVRMPEIFSLDPVAERTDGYWGTIVGTRLMRFQYGDQTFRTPRMGSGVFPAYAYQCSNWNERSECGLRILHYGYAREEDRIRKHERYTSIVANGHNDRHIQSILKEPTLRAWDGEIPCR